MRLVDLASVVVASMIAVSCGGGAGGTGRVESQASTTSSSVTTTPLATGLSCSTPTDAARALVAGWMAGDRGASGRCATPDVVATLFTRSRGAVWTFQGCDGPDPGLPVCAYSYTGGTARLTLHGTEANGWTVDSVTVGSA